VKATGHAQRAIIVKSESSQQTDSHLVPRPAPTARFAGTRGRVQRLHKGGVFLAGWRAYVQTADRCCHRFMVFIMLFIDKATITRAAFRTLRRAARTFLAERLLPPRRPISRKYALISSLMPGGCGIGVSSLITGNCTRAESRLSIPRRTLSTGPSGSWFKRGGGGGDGLPR
jgi:hypothetical protein